jgi:hypothetical protein
VRGLSRLLTLLLLLGTAGTLLELLLLGHVEGWQQLVPVVLLALGALVTGWHMLTPGSVSLRAVRWVGGLYVASGLVGLWFHYVGNVEFEREMAPDAAGWLLIKAALTGATPALAPGTMVWFGALALVIGWQGGRTLGAVGVSAQE